MKVLVSGAGGFLGSHVVSRLLERGHTVRAIIRPASREPRWLSTVELFRADLRVQSDLVLAFNDIDAVIHLAAATSGNEDSQFNSTVVVTERFLTAMALSPVKRLIHISSLVVYDWTKVPKVMDEATPLLSDAYDMGAYTMSKVWQERLVSRFSAAHKWKLTIMRPGFIWGPGHADIGGMGRHFGRLYVMFGPLTRLPLTYITNCADCIVAALESPNSTGEAFNIVDRDEIRVWRYVREYARRTSQRGFLIPIPYCIGLFIAHLAALTSKALFGKNGKLPSLLMPRRYTWQFKPIRFNTKKLRETLRWRPPLSFNECLANSYRSNPSPPVE
jgi:nucleoside-diphosphate-sugar epimerase